MAKAKKKTLAKVADDCAVKLQLLVRLKAADQNGNCKCVSCPAVKHWAEMQGGHYVGRGVNATKLLEENVHPQCRRCNLRATTSHVGYTLFMVETYGLNFIKVLREMMNESKRWKRSELLDLSSDFDKQIQYQRERLGIEG